MKEIGVVIGGRQVPARMTGRAIGAVGAFDDQILVLPVLLADVIPRAGEVPGASRGFRLVWAAAGFG